MRGRPAGRARPLRQAIPQGIREGLCGSARPLPQVGELDVPPPHHILCHCYRGRGAAGMAHVAHAVGNGAQRGHRLPLRYGRHACRHIAGAHHRGARLAREYRDEDTRRAPCTDYQRLLVPRRSGRYLRHPAHQAQELGRARQGRGCGERHPAAVHAHQLGEGRPRSVLRSAYDHRLLATSTSSMP